MAITPRRQVQIWGIALAVLVLVLWLLGATLLPFLMGAAIAYFLDPLVDRLQRLGIGRGLATSIIAVTVLLLCAVLLVVAVPALVWQVQGLVEAMPDYLNRVMTLLAYRYPELFGENSPLWRNMSGFETMLRENGMTVANQVLAGSLKVIDYAILLVVTPVVAFYLLLDWDRLVERANAILPREHALTIRRLAREIDAVLAGFVRGQLTVCLILGGFYAIALALIGLQFGILVGLIAGLLSFIPYIGSIVGMVLSIGIALFQFWGEWFWVAAVAGVFFFGQFVEGNILSPNLVGKSVGLHPVWLILALSVFGALFGFAGLLVAVPVAAALGVISRFLLDQYLASPLYTGRAPPPEP